MIWIVLIVALILIAFFKDLNKDEKELKTEPITKKFAIIISIINNCAYNGEGKIVLHPNDKRTFHIYKEDTPQIIIFEYGTGHLTITWRFKYLLDNEVVYKETFNNVRNISSIEQENIAKYVVSEVDKMISNKMKETWGINPNKMNFPRHSEGDFNEKTINALNILLDNLSNKLNRQPTFNDFIVDRINKYGYEDTEDKFHGFTRLWEASGRKLNNAGEVYNRYFKH